MFKRITSLNVIICFFLTALGPYPQAYADSVLGLPAPGTMVSTSPSFTPALIRGLTVHKDNPFLFDFIVDPGNSLPLVGRAREGDLKDQADRMIKYFFAALTIPDKDIWVNLSPYEKDRMIPVSLGKTAMGRDLLAQDYMLKQLTASLIYPQRELGRAFWSKVYAKAKEMYGTTQVPVNTFNKVWIVPQKAGVYEHGQTAFIVSGHLKVMLEEDYLSMRKHNSPPLVGGARGGVVANQAPSPNLPHQGGGINALSSQIIRSLILPAIEKEINEGKNFATLRQIFYAQVLAVWFKRNLKQALLNRVYANKGTVKGIDQNDTATNEAIYRQYLQAYKKGVFNFIKEESFPTDSTADSPPLAGGVRGGVVIPRKYFSGGFGDLAQLAIEPVAKFPDAAMADAPKYVDFAVLAASPKAAATLALKSDAAMNIMAIVRAGASYFSADSRTKRRLVREEKETLDREEGIREFIALIPHVSYDEFIFFYETLAKMRTRFGEILFKRFYEEIYHQAYEEMPDPIKMWGYRSPQIRDAVKRMFFSPMDIANTRAEEVARGILNRAMLDSDAAMTALRNKEGEDYQTVIDRLEPHLKGLSVEIYSKTGKRKEINMLEYLQGIMNGAVLNVVSEGVAKEFQRLESLSNKELVEDKEVKILLASFSKMENELTLEKFLSVLSRSSGPDFAHRLRSFVGSEIMAIEWLAGTDLLPDERIQAQEYLKKSQLETALVFTILRRWALPASDGAMLAATSYFPGLDERKFPILPPIARWGPEYFHKENHIFYERRHRQYDLVVWSSLDPEKLNVGIRYKAKLIPFVQCEYRGTVISGIKRFVSPELLTWFVDDVLVRDVAAKSFAQFLKKEFQTEASSRKESILESGFADRVEQLIATAQATTVKVEVNDSGKFRAVGSGFFISMGGEYYLVTATHILQTAGVLNPMAKYRAAWGDGKNVNLKLQGIAQDRDVAVFKLGLSLAGNLPEQFPTLPVRRAASKLEAEPVIQFGYNMATPIRAQRNKVSMVWGWVQDSFGPEINMNSPRVNGMLGGPLVDLNTGEIIGVNSKNLFTVFEKASVSQEMLREIIGKPDAGGQDAAMTPGGIDLSQQDSALHVEKDANGGVKVNVDPALIARIEREGMPEVIPVIINMQPADIRSLLGVETAI